MKFAFSKFVSAPVNSFRRSLVASTLLATTVIGLAGTGVPQRRASQPQGEPQKEPHQETYRILEFEFVTGDDDLRTDSTLQAEITLGRYREQCFLHGPGAGGNDSQISWGNNSTHMGAPCPVSVPFTAHDIQTHSKIVLSEFGLSGAGVETWDNWNIKQITIYAHNEGSKDRVKVFCTTTTAFGKPVARMTGDASNFTVTDFPNNC